MTNLHSFTQALAQHSCLLLDGALATELETRGCNIADRLWSAKILYQQPELIRDVHLDYFRAGARCAITASYQATLPGFASKGFTPEQALALIARSVSLAQQARELWQQEAPDAPPVWIAGSVGPYGAWLGDGSEYRGDYQCSFEEFSQFHRPRVEALLEAGADLLACETLPSANEIVALAELLSDYPNAKAWFSVTLRDSYHLSDGTPLSEVIEIITGYPQIIAFGINCVSLADTTATLQYLQRLTTLPLVVYPNSGESYDPLTKRWHHHCQGSGQLVDYLEAWRASGARLIGGCCRTSPADIQQLAQALAPESADS